MDTTDIVDLNEQLDKAERDAQIVVAGLSEEQGLWRPGEHSWSVAQCLQHLALTNGAYLRAMQDAATRAREQRRFRRRPAAPGLLGRWFLATVEPPAKAPFKIKAPQIIQPSETESLSSALDSFRRSQDQVRSFLVSNSDLDLASIRFSNPFIRGIRFTLATGLHIIAAHERRHLWQADRARRAAEEAYG